MPQRGPFRRSCVSICTFVPVKQVNGVYLSAGAGCRKVTPEASLAVLREGWRRNRGNQFTCFTSRKVQILTRERRSSLANWPMGAPAGGGGGGGGGTRGPKAPAVKARAHHSSRTRVGRHWCRGSRQSLCRICSGGGDCRRSRELRGCC